jgi:hypothetical protein
MGQGFGLWSHCPADAIVAWGARAIIEKNYAYDPLAGQTKAGKMRKRIPEGQEHKLYPHNIDLVWDRTSMRGPEPTRKTFAEMLNRGPFKKAILEARRLLSQGDMRTERGGTFNLYAEVHDGVMLKVLGNTNGSCGYLYLIAFLTTSGELSDGKAETTKEA